MNVALMVQPENNKTQVQPDSSTTILQTAIQDGLPHSTDIQSTACLAVPLLSHFQMTACDLVFYAHKNQITYGIDPDSSDTS